MTGSTRMRGNKHSTADNKSSVVVKSRSPIFSIEEAFTILQRPSGKEENERPDEHLTGVYFHIVEGNYFITETGRVQFLDFSRFFQKVKTCSLESQEKKKIRDKCKKKDGLGLKKYLTHPHFKECFRFKIGKILIGHLKSMNSVHALYLAFAISIASKTFSVSLSHSYRLNGKIRQKNFCPMTFLFLYFQKSLRGLKTEKEVVKKIKVSLCTEFSIQADQELPDGHENSFRIFPTSMANVLKGSFTSRKDRLRFYFSVLQSKTLCREVSDDMVIQELLKHRKTLCEGETRTLDQEFRKELIRQGKELGIYLRNHYNPYKTSKAPISASFDYSRKKNGVLGEMIDKNMVLTTPNSLIGDPEDRCEPLVLGLFGEPACGKTTLVQDLIQKIQRELFPEYDLTSVSYSRSCSMKHWDGYKGQPIVVLDDFGQSSDRLDVVEFQQLVSCNPYQLPMASLDDKGELFNSPIIILTSNLQFGVSLSTQNSPEPIEDNKAFWRRIHLPILLGFTGTLGDRKVIQKDHIIATGPLSHCLTEEEKASFKPLPRWQKELKSVFFSPCCSSDIRILSNSTLPTERQRRPAWDAVDVFCTSEFPRQNIVQLLLRMALNHQEFFRQKTSKFWTQNVSSETLSVKVHESGVQTEEVAPFISYGETHSVFYRFPRSPPKEGLLPVRVEPIKEPLKVRIITAGVAETRCLKPLQKSMWDYLGTKRQFKLTHGTKYLERSVWNCRSIEQPDIKLQEGLDNLKRDNPGSSKIWISGDYSSATDNFILECGSVILEEALLHIKHNPTKEWAMNEMSSHCLVYPKDSGLKPGIQRNGQLMGSLLSFPLLCLVNDSTAVLAGAKDSEYLINGDDILMRVEPSVGANWKRIAPKLGLELSIGKTFSDPEFGTVNSQLFYDGTLVPTGKLKTCSRRTQVLGETYRDFQRFHTDEDFSNIEHLKKIYLKLNRPQLTKTFESLSIGVSHGGLGLITLPEETANRRTMDFFVYLSKLRKKLQPLKGVLKLPFVGLSNEHRDSRISSLLSIPEEVDWEEGVSGAEVNETAKKCRGDPKLRTLLLALVNKEINLIDLPDLDFVQIREVKYLNPDYRSQQESIQNRFLGQFLDLESVILDSESRQLLERFRCEKKRRLQVSLGVLSDPIEIPDASLLHSELVPELLCCERLWSKILLGRSSPGSKELEDLPPVMFDPPFQRVHPVVEPEELSNSVVFSSDSITQWDVSPTMMTEMPIFEEGVNRDLSTLLEPMVP